MKKFKVLTVVGTRPEIIRLSAVIKKLEETSSIEHTLVHTGQNYDYELNEIFFKDLRLDKPKFFLNAAGTSASSTIGNVITKVEEVLLKVQPDAFLVLGDTNSCLCAIPAKKMRIPVFHMEAGNRCFDMRVPEEINRRIVDHVSDINLTYSTIARNYLLREGIPPDRIVKTGSPMFEVLHSNIDSIDNSNVLDDLNLEYNKYFLVSSHRAENVDSDNGIHNVVKILNFLSQKYDFPVIVSTHPRTRNRLHDSGLELHSNIRLLKPLGFFSYIQLQRNAKVVLSDSGTISEESSILNFPALNLREAHERPEAMEEAAVMMVGQNIERISQALEVLEEQTSGKERLLHLVNDYGNDNVSDKVIRIILSYTDYVNQKTWFKKLS